MIYAWVETCHFSSRLAADLFSDGNLEIKTEAGVDQNPPLAVSVASVFIFSHSSLFLVILAPGEVAGWTH